MAPPHRSTRAHPHSSVDRWSHVRGGAGPGANLPGLPLEEREETILAFLHKRAMVSARSSRRSGRSRHWPPDPKVHGFILAKGSVETLRALLDDPATRSVKLADFAFDLGTPDITSQWKRIG